MDKHKKVLLFSSLIGNLVCYLVICLKTNNLFWFLESDYYTAYNIIFYLFASNLLLISILLAKVVVNFIINNN